MSLDFSKFRKIAEDNKTATLRHPAGHHLKIAKGGLSSGLKKQLEDLPVYKADAGGPEDDPSAYVEPDKTDDSDPSAAPEQDMDEDSPEPAAPATPAAAPAAAPAAQGAPAAAPAASAPTVNAGAMGNAAPQVIPKGPPPKQVSEMDAEEAKHRQDVAQGIITPETVKSLFGKQDTPGKIATIFGMMLSGAGAGLAHQKDTFLEMMQKQIDNDFEAQQKTASNAYNYKNLAQAHELQNAQVVRSQFENELSKAQAGAIPSENKLRIANANAIDAQNAGLYGANSAKNKTATGVYQSLQDDVVDKLPPGPTKDNAQAVLNNVVSPAIDAYHHDNNVKTANLAQSAYDAQNPPPKEDTGVDTDRVQKMVTAGQVTGLSTKNTIAPAEVGPIDAEIAHVQKNRAIAKMYDAAFKEMDKEKLAGRLNQAKRNALIATLGGQIESMTSGSISAATATARANTLFPDALDWGGSRDEKFKQAMEQFKANESNTPALDKKHLKTPFPNYSFSTQKEKKPEVTQESGIQYKGGVPYQQNKNGDWQKVKNQTAGK